MADLRSVVEELGFEDAKTLLQSGNVVFTATAPAAKIESALEKALQSKLSMDIGVIVLTREQLAAVVKANPFSMKDKEGAKLAVTFVRGGPKPKSLPDVSAPEYAPDDI